MSLFSSWIRKIGFAVDVLLRNQGRARQSGSSVSTVFTECTKILFGVFVLGACAFIELAVADDSAVSLARYACHRQKFVAINPNTKDYMPPFDINDESFPDYNPPDFVVNIINAKPNKRCPDYYKNAPFIFWMECQAKYAIEFDGYKQRARSFSFAEIKSDNGNVFYGQFGSFFQIGNKTYIAQYSDEGTQYLEVGTCQKR